MGSNNSTEARPNYQRQIYTRNIEPDAPDDARNEEIL
jgi:hypothetical protein